MQFITYDAGIEGIEGIGLRSQNICVYVYVYIVYAYTALKCVASSIPNTLLGGKIFKIGSRNPDHANYILHNVVCIRYLLIIGRIIT